MEDNIGLSGVHVPNELAVLERRSRRHHPVDPLRVEQRLVDVWRLVVELAVHVEVVASLQGGSTDTARFLGADSTSQGDLAGHGGIADDRLV